MEKSVKLGVIGLSGQSAFFEVDHFHEPGETLSADTLFMEPGGKGYNQAVAARRLGAEVLYLTCLGRDDFGRQCLERLGKEGVSPMIKWSDKATAFATILTDAAGDNQITVFAGASGDLTRQDVLDAEEALASCDMLLMQLECPLETVEAALDVAEKHNIPTVLNTAPAKPISLSILRRFSLLIPNQHEAATLLGMPERTTADSLAEAYQTAEMPPAVITLGSAGAMLVTKDRIQRLSSKTVLAQDTTGAGDTFCAALVTRLAAGARIEEAVAFANVAASISVRHAHVLDGLPHLSDVEDALRFNR